VSFLAGAGFGPAFLSVVCAGAWAGASARTGVKPEPNRHATASADTLHKINFCFFISIECDINFLSAQHHHPLSKTMPYIYWYIKIIFCPITTYSYYL
jgi:hypothetical protein